MLRLLVTIVLCAGIVPDAEAKTRTCTDPHTGYVYSDGETYRMVSSWYGKSPTYDFHGKSTASGVTFDRFDPTMVAHKVLPLGTKIEVTNPSNGKTAEATVVDDGPHPKGRDLDSSEALAEHLDFKHAGTAKLQVRIISMSGSECRDDGEGLR